MLFQIFKAILTGFCASAPLGPVAVLVLQKTLNYGRTSGFVTGIGAAFIDTLYALIGVFALSAISDFIDRQREIIYLVGGVLVILVGLLMFLRKSLEPVREVSHFTMAGYAVQAAGMALANPGAIALMMAFLAVFKVDGPSWATVPSVALGAILWWYLFAFIVDRFRGSLKMSTVIMINKVLGVLVMIFGLVCIIKGF